MITFLTKWAVNALALYVVVYVIPGIAATGPVTVLMVALVLGLINAFVRPFLILITLPINVLSLGIFTFFINGFIFYIVARVVKGFTVTGFWPAFFGALLYSFVSLLLSLLIRVGERTEVRYYRYR